MGWLSSPTQTWSSGGGRPRSSKVTLAIDSNGDSASSVLKPTTRRAFSIPGQ